MKLAALLAALAVASLPDPAAARATASRCHCERYTNPHSSSYVPRTAPYRGGRAYRW